MPVISFSQLDDVLVDFKNDVKEALAYLEKDKASLNKDNVFIGNNTFNEVNLIGKTPFVSTGGSKQTSAHRVDRYCGDRRVSTHHNGSPNHKYVSSIKIEVLPSVNIGDKVSDIYITEITKGANRLVDIVGNTIVNGGSFLVEQDSTGAKVIYVPIQREYAVDTYFLIGKQGDRNLRESWDAYSPKDEFVNDLPIDSLPQVGSPLDWTTGNGWVTIYSLVEDDINVRDELEALNNKIINSGAISSVNGQPPVNGEVTIDGTHISATIGNSNATIQDHLTTIGNGLHTVNINVNNHDTRLLRLENRVPTVQVGDIINTFRNSGDDYTVGGVTYLYCGKTRTVQTSSYPDLPSALGITGSVSAFQLPVITDSNVIYDNGRTAVRKNYIVARIN